MSLREVCQPIFQGEDEKVVRSLVTTAWGPNPTNILVKVYNLSSGSRVDESETILDGVASAVNDIISLPIVQNLLPGNRYRLEFKFDSSNGNTYEGFFEIYGEH